MFRFTLQIALRNLWKQKRHSGINVLGMATGMTCCFLILIFIHHERHYDEFHPNGDRLFRLNYEAQFSSNAFVLTRCPSPIGPMLTEHFPQVEVAARFFPRSISIRAQGNDRALELENGLFADSTASRVFHFDFLQGDPETALRHPFSIVLTDETAQKIFGKTEVLGESVLLAGQSTPFRVSGVVRDFPENAHLHFDFLAPYANIVDVEPAYARENILTAQTTNWLASYTYTYVLLKPGASYKEFNAAFPAFLHRFGNENFRDKQAFVLFPVPDIHLRSESSNEPEPVANTAYLKLFAIVGLLILLIACINFINLSNSIYLSRMKEVGVRKVLGAGRAGLIRQFMLEALLLCGFAFLIALVLTPALLPYMETLTNRHLNFDLLRNWLLVAAFLGIFAGAGLLAGTYPAFFASRFQPVDIFQQHGGHTGGRQWLRKSLITVQFMVGIGLLSGTFIVLSQLRYWQNRPLGFDTEQVLAVPLFSPSINSAFAPGDAGMRARMNTFEERLAQNPRVEAVTLSSALPGLSFVRYPITTDRISMDANVVLPCISVDYDFLQTYGMRIVAGRNFGKEYGTDHVDGFIINEKAVKTLGWDSPEKALGQMITKGGKTGKVVGVVNDFNSESLQTALEPVVMDINVGAFTTFSIRVNSAEMPKTLQFLETTWKACFPEKAFDYSFLNENLQDSYQDEQRFARLISSFAAIAIFLSCFGLFGLISFTVQQKSKEIGIRKVLGSTVAAIVGLLAKDYLKLVLFAMVLATPPAWYLMHRWLSDFAYHVDISPWMFAVAGAGAMAVAFLTVGAQSVRAALANPVDSLRNE